MGQEYGKRKRKSRKTRGNFKINKGKRRRRIDLVRRQGASR